MRLRALAAAASLALLAAGCGSQAPTSTSVHRASSHHAGAGITGGSTGRSSHSEHGAGNPASPPPPVTATNAIRRAAAKLQAAPGYTFKLSASLNVPSFGGPAKLTGSGSFDTAADAGSIEADVTPPGILSLLGEVETNVILSGSKLYMLMPDSLDGTPIGGKAWGEATFTQLETLAGVSGPTTLASLLAALPHSRDARVWLDPQGRISRVNYAYRSARLGRLAITIRITGYGPHTAPTRPTPRRSAA